MSKFWTQLFKPVLAADPFGKIDAPPAISQYGGTQGQGLITLLNNIMKMMIVVAGVFALFNFIVAGYNYISANGESDKIESAGNKILWSIIGLLVAAGSFTLAAVIGKLVFNDFGAIINPKIYTP